MSGQLESFDVVVEPVATPTVWNSSPMRWLNVFRRRRGFVVTVYEQGLSFPRYRECLASHVEAEARADELRAVVRKGGALPKQSFWQRI